jgi:TOMM system kinase/cyclase fusion protein
VTVQAVDPTELRTLLNADYELQHRLGQGAYGTVFKAIQRSTGQPVAIKVQRLSREQSEEQRASLIGRFERETELCATLNHPAIVRIIDQGRYDDFLVIMFEFVPGETLAEHLARRRCLPPGEAVSVMAQVLDALDVAHSRGIVHRDLKPENIMIVTTGTQSYVKVLDFGIGAYATGAPVPVTVLTRSQEILGTPCYSAPEQLRGDPTTSRSDVYAWGLVLLECLTGQRVMDGLTMAQVFYKQLSANEILLPPALATHALGDIIRRAVAKDPRQRASDAGQLGLHLRRVRVSDLVGLIAPESTARPAKTVSIDAGAYPGEQRQATVFSCSLTALATAPGHLDLEMFDAVQRDQLGMCADVVTRFGGHLVGRLANRIVAVFGLPHASDSDARRACRAALELCSRMESRRAILSSQRGITLELRVGIHTDLVIVDIDGTPAGPAVNLATRLESMADAGVALVSAPTRDLVYRRIRLRSFDSGGFGGALPPGRLYTLVSEDSAGDAADASSGGGPRSPLVGREPELEALAGHWGAARAGDGRVVSVRGEPGIGKSRLVQELRQRALQGGALAFECQCLPEDGNTALQPVLTFIRQYFELDRGPSRTSPDQLHDALSLAKLDPALIIPILFAWLGLPAPDRYPQPQLSGERQRELLLDALVHLVCEVVEGEARLLIFEDLQWADPTSLELVARIGRQVARSPVLVLLTMRSGFDAKIETAAAIELAGLDDEAVARLIEQNSAGRAMDADTRASIIERTDGIPLFVEELTRSLDHAAGTLTASGSLPKAAIPSSLQDLLNGRLDRLGVTKETAQLAAAIGREFDVELLNAISLRGREPLQADLDALVDEGMIYRRLHANARYVFRHALIREAASESMLAGQRRSVHHRIATTLERRIADGGTAEPARLAWHYELAVVPDKAIGWLLAAGQQAGQASALQEALGHLRRGLALVKDVADPGVRDSLEIDLLNAIGGTLIATQGLATPSVVETFTRSMELVRAGAPSPLQSFRTLRGLWTFHNARADYTAARELANRLLELAAAQDRAELYLAANECATQTALLTGEFEVAVQHGQECERWFDPALQRELIARYGGDPWLTALSFQCIATTLLGYPDKARAKLDLLRDRAEELGVPVLKAVISAQRAWVELLLSACVEESDHCRDLAVARANEATEIARGFGIPFVESYGQLLRAMAGALGGRQSDLDDLAKSLQFWQFAGSKAFMSWPLAFRAHGLVLRGDFTGAAREARGALAHCRETGEAYGVSEAYRIIGLVASEAGDSEGGWDRAVGAFDEAIGVARAQGGRWLALRAAFTFARSASSSARPASDRARALDILKHELKWFEETGEGLATPLWQAASRLVA